MYPFRSRSHFGPVSKASFRWIIFCVAYYKIRLSCNRCRIRFSMIGMCNTPYYALIYFVRESETDFFTHPTLVFNRNNQEMNYIFWQKRLGRFNTRQDRSLFHSNNKPWNKKISLMPSWGRIMPSNFPSGED